MATNALTIADERQATPTNIQQDGSTLEWAHPSIAVQLRLVPVPTPRATVRRRMHWMSELIGGPVERLPVGLEEEAPRALRLPMANLIVMGTACSRPLFLEEAKDVSEITGQAIVIVRLDSDPCVPEGLTFDFLADSGAAWVENAVMWQDASRHGVWLVPAAGEGRSVRLSAFSREIISRAPFYSLEERTAGLLRAANSLHSLREAG